MSARTPSLDPYLRWATDQVVQRGREPLDLVDRTQTTRLVGHFVACALEGGRTPWGRQVRDMAAGRSLEGATGLLIGSGATPPAADAVFANAALAQSTLGEDVHRRSLTHPASVVVPAALAAAQHHARSGERFLSAVAVGYDVLCGLATVLTTPELVRRGWRPTSVFGPVGAAAAAASLGGLLPEEVASAIAIAANTGAGTREWAHAGSTDVYAQNGFAARNGLTAADLAAAGIRGPGSVFDGRAGWRQALAGGDGDSVDASALPVHRHVHEVEVKRYPACSAVQGVIELACAAHMRHRWSPASVEHVDVWTHRHGVTNPGCDHPGPFEDVGQAQMSNQACVALALHGEPMDLRSFARHGEDSVTRLARRVRVHEDPGLTSTYPDRVAARLVVRLAGGRTVTEHLDTATSLTQDEIARAVSETVETHYGPSRGPALVAALEDLHRHRHLDDLARLLRSPHDQAAAGAGT